MPLDRVKLIYCPCSLSKEIEKSPSYENIDIEDCLVRSFRIELKRVSDMELNLIRCYNHI